MGGRAMSGELAIRIREPLEVPVLRQLLPTEIFGQEVHVLASTTSTNDEARILAQRGAPEGTVVLAEEQTHGRGRQGRSFASPAGVGIYLSLLLRPRMDPARLPPLTLLAAVAVAEAITEVCALPVSLKWPNDVQIHGKKVAGILLETLIGAENAPVVIMGIGINVNTTLEQLPDTLRASVTSLALAAGRPFSRHRLIAALLTYGEQLYREFRAGNLTYILQRWLHYGRALLGQRVQYTQHREVQEGTVLGLDNDGALLVQTTTGLRQRLVSAEVTFLSR